MPRTIVLAYSGGLDTSIIVPWLKEHYDARIICVAADIGQGEAELRGVRDKALASGAEECYVEDLRDEFVADFIFPTLRAGAIYNRKYLLGTSMARPLIAKRQVEVARRVGADQLDAGAVTAGDFGRDLQPGGGRGRRCRGGLALRRWAAAGIGRDQRRGGAALKGGERQQDRDHNRSIKAATVPVSRSRSNSRDRRWSPSLTSSVCTSAERSWRAISIDQVQGTSSSFWP